MRRHALAVARRCISASSSPAKRLAGEAGSATITIPARPAGSVSHAHRISPRARTAAGAKIRDARSGAVKPAST